MRADLSRLPARYLHVRVIALDALHDRLQATFKGRTAKPSVCRMLPRALHGFGIEYCANAGHIRSPSDGTADLEQCFASFVDALGALVVDAHVTRPANG